MEQHLQVSNVTDCDSKTTNINDLLIAELTDPESWPNSPQTLDFGVLLPIGLGDGQLGAQQIKGSVHVTHSGPFSVTGRLFIIWN